MFRYVSCDLETLGLNPDTCDMIEVGAVIDDLSNPLPLERLPVFHCYVKRESYRGEPFAMSMHSKILRRIATMEEGYTYLYPGQVCQALAGWLVRCGVAENKYPVRFNVAGKNFGTFDLRFLRRLPKFEEFLRPRHRIFDPASRLFDPAVDSELPGMELCMERLGIEPNVTHEAVADALDIVRIIRRIYGVEPKTE